jgi:hypothetical protein
MLIVIALSLALLACNVAFCGHRVTIDWSHGRSAQVIWGLLALSGALMAFFAMLWALLASLTHY